MNTEARAQSLETWARVALYGGGVCGLLAGIASGASADVLIVPIVLGGVGAGLGALSGHLWSLPLLALAAILRDLDAVREDARSAASTAGALWRRSMEDR